MLRLLVFCLLTLTGASWGYAQSLDDPNIHRLSPGDKVSLRVVIWDEDERDYVIWQAVSGEFLVQSGGRIMVPLAGRILAEGHTPEELADEVADALQVQVRSNSAPSIAIEVVQYGPFFIMGDVDNPGAYPAQPGLTALQAFALAGGGQRLDEVGIDTLAIMRETGALEQIQTELLRARITSIRLRAEVEEQDGLQFPDTLVPVAGSAPLDVLLEEERRIFTARKTALEREQASLSELITLLTTEIETLQRKIEGQQEQLKLAEEYLKNTQSLVDKGLARAPQLTQAQKGVFDIEAKTLDLQNSFYRAQQSVKEAERDVVALKANRATQAAVELQNVNARIEMLSSRRDTARRMLLERGAVVGFSDEDRQYDRSFRVQRGNGADRRIFEGPDTIVIPGDIITVEQTLSVPETAPPG
ncbi:polysaccharide biosynthesis/export family protein [Ruegeria sp. 2205SS24-7]|uniref:polysaccharide biosynthesis/export family protein n=1 Tax=Ruegeria discodermiae TaxID=3064389 RepID=UPI002742523A|nr:polysaccharide biosynthesis/export family protein [Ruegeria sp. 2205SS24-7]MDP5220857.1 polysaccharide biosynthesis/export family protein [Ruegeria sp. 2205SS24-7]